MKRDMDLIRAILLDMEADGTDDKIRSQIGEYAEETVGHHRWLILQAGLATGLDATGAHDAARVACLDSLTWDGHDFLAVAKDDTAWRKVKTATKGFATGSLKNIADALTGLVAVTIAREVGL